MTGVVAPHGCKDFTNLAEVLLNRSLLDRLPLRKQKAGMDALRENMEKSNGVLNVFEVRGDFQRAAKVPPLAPGVGVFLEDVCGETLGDSLFCSMVVRLPLHADGRGSRRQGLFYGKCVQKWERNFRPGR